jgi:hypothetical protein
MMQGEISVDSIKGQGTEFQVYIPDVPVMESPESSARAKNQSESNADLSSTAYKELTELIFREFISKFGSQAKANEFLRNQIWSEYDKIADILGFDEVISFTGLLLEISEKNDLQYLKEFGNRLSREAASFNVIEINRMLTSFESLRQYNLP